MEESIKRRGRKRWVKEILERVVIVGIFDWFYLREAKPKHVRQTRRANSLLLFLPSTFLSLLSLLRLGGFSFRRRAVLVAENPSEINSLTLREPNSRILAEKEHHREPPCQSGLPPLSSLSIFISISLYSPLLSPSAL